MAKRMKDQKTGQLTLTMLEPDGLKEVAAVEAVESTAGDVGSQAAKPADAAPTNGDTAATGDLPKAARRKAVVDHSMAASMATKQREISVSEFFAKNRHLLGFDNKSKALLTSVKEAVDNSLDACEEAGILPDIEVELKQLTDDRFRVGVHDNGPGIVVKQIPNVFGKLLYGSKFHRLKMSRGQQGIGISAAGMYGLLTTGKPVRILSRTGESQPAHKVELRIDTAKNRPDIIKNDEVEVDWPHGTRVEIEMTGSYKKGKQSVDEYMLQTAIANPHARFVYRNPLGGVFTYERASDEMPVLPQEIKPHPYGLDLGNLLRLLKETSEKKLAGFLQNHFSRVSPAVAREICKAAKLSVNEKPQGLSLHQAEALYRGMQDTKIKSPPTDCVSPIGAKQILAGLLQGVKAEFYTAVTARSGRLPGQSLPDGGRPGLRRPVVQGQFRQGDPLCQPRAAALSAVGLCDLQGRGRYQLAQLRIDPA